MEHLIDALSATLAETRFDFEYREHAQETSNFASRRGRFRDGSASMLREWYERDVEGRNLKVSIRQDAPEALMATLLDVLRVDLVQFIDPEAGTIGHSFPIEAPSSISFHGSDQGLLHSEYQSALGAFARALVQASAVSSVQSVVARLTGWCQGDSLQVRMTTVLTGILLSDTVALTGDVELVPLGLSTADLPRLPMFWSDRASDYLGHTLLTLGVSTSPVLFQPKNDDNGGLIRTQSLHGLNLEVVRDAMSLVTNRNVTLSRIWLEYPTAGGFRLSGPAWTSGTDRPKRRFWKTISSSMGTTEVTPHDDEETISIDPEEVNSTIKATSVPTIIRTESIG